MKKSFFSLLALVTILTGTISCNIDTREPVQYHDEIISYYDKLDNKISIISTSFDDESITLDEIENLKVECQNIITEELTKLETIKPMEGDQGLLQNVVIFYKDSRKILDENYTQILNILNERDSLTDADVNKLVELDDEAIELINKNTDLIINTQQKFADHFNIELVNNDEEK